MRLSRETSSAKVWSGNDIIKMRRNKRPTIPVLAIFPMPVPRPLNTVPEKEANSAYCAA